MICPGPGGLFRKELSRLEMVGDCLVAYMSAACSVRPLGKLSANARSRLFSFPALKQTRQSKAKHFQASVVDVINLNPASNFNGGPFIRHMRTSLVVFIAPQFHAEAGPTS